MKDEKKGFFSLGMLAVAVLTLAFLGTGCVVSPVRYSDSRVTVASELGRKVWVTDVRLLPGEGSHRTLQVNVVNSTRDVTRLEYKVVWMDATGLEIPSVVSTWQADSLSGLEIRNLRATAPSPQAVDFRFYVKEAR